MRKVLVFQHAAHEILGTLNPLLKERGFRVRYVNFHRHPDMIPSIEKYDGLVVLGGNMGVYEADAYPHIKVELKIIEEALKKDIPILGICLGSQMLAHVLGSPARKAQTKEIGWCDVELTDQAKGDPVFKDFAPKEKIFQMHGDTFDVPKSATHLAHSKEFPAQAFRVGNKVYGMQFHLEVDQPMIHRWLKADYNKEFLKDSNHEQILKDTDVNIERALKLSRATFARFIESFGEFERQELLGSEHAKPSKKR